MADLVTSTTIRIKFETEDGLNMILEKEELGSMDMVVKHLLYRDRLLSKLLERFPALQESIEEMERNDEIEALEARLKKLRETSKDKAPKVEHVVVEHPPLKSSALPSFYS